MSGFLIDTNVFSEPRRPRPNAAVIEWLRAHESELYTSAVVIGELAWGIARLPKGKKRRDLDRWLDTELIARMEGRILRFDTRVALEWGALQATLESVGKSMPWRDSVIAATARRHALDLVTRNVNDYRNTGIKIINPFDSH